MPRGQYNLALVHEQRGNGAAARAAYEAEAAQPIPSNYGAQFNLGKLLLKEGRLAEATARFRAAVEARPEFAEGYLYLAKALLDGGDLPGAATGRAATGWRASRRPLDRAARPLRARRRLQPHGPRERGRARGGAARALERGDDRST